MEHCINVPPHDVYASHNIDFNCLIVTSPYRNQVNDDDNEEKPKQKKIVTPKFGLTIFYTLPHSTLYT